MDTSLYAASSHYYSLSTVLAEQGRGTVSQRYITRFFQWVTDLETVRAKAAIEYAVHWGRSEHDVQHVVFRCLIEKWLLVDLEDKTYPIDVRCQKCTHLRSIYHRSELEMSLSWTKTVSPMAAQPIIPSAASLMPISNASRRETFPRSFQTRIWSSKYYTQIRDSSEKTTLCYSCIQLCRSVH